MKEFLNKIQRHVKLHRFEYKKKRLQMKMNRYFKPGSEAYDIYRQEWEYVLKKGLKPVPYDFADEYSYTDVEIMFDNRKQLPYVVHNGKRLYFGASMRPDTIQKLYAGLLVEQHPASPHRYLTGEFTVSEGDILLDVGSAEGILSLDRVETAGKIYLFEKDSRWIDALHATFEPYGDKVEIIEKYVSSRDGEHTVTLDSFLKDKPAGNLFVKLDVEGEEMRVIEGMKRTLAERPVKVAVCTYHRYDDAEKIPAALEAQGMQCAFSEGYMLYFNDMKNLRPPYFRKGLVRAGNRFPDTVNG